MNSELRIRNGRCASRNDGWGERARRIFVFALVLGLIVSRSHAITWDKLVPIDLRLTEDSKALCPIVISTSASKVTQFAAEELQRYLNQLSGAKFEIVRVPELPGPPLHEDGAIELISDSGSEQGLSIIQHNGKSVSLLDGTDTELLASVYRLLGDLGCVWLSPSFDFYKGQYEVVPTTRSLSIRYPAQFASSPRLVFRKLYVEEGLSHDEASLKALIDWMPKAGYNTLVVPMDYQNRGRVKWDNWRVALTPEIQKRGLILEVGGHGYQNFLNAKSEEGRLFTEHPEWFGQDAEGKRSRRDRDVFCTSNAAAVDYITSGVIAYLRARPEIKIFDFWPPDGAVWCSCDACKALGDPSDRHAIVVNTMRARVAKELPGVRVECIAYSKALDPPKTVKLDSAVLVDFCPINQSFEKQISDPTSERNAGYVKALQAWRSAFEGDISIYSYYRKYAWKSLPVIIPHYMQEDLKWYAKLPVQGVSVYGEPGDWGTYELNHYTLARLARDPDVNVDAVIDEFCTARYGKSATAARQLLMAFEQNMGQYSSIPFSSLKSTGDIAAGLNAINEAREELKREPASPAIERLLLASEYAARDLEIQQARAAKRPAEEIGQKVTALCTILEANAKRGVFIMHNRNSLPVLLKRYGVDDKQTTVPAEAE